jgi:hypothetical protein
MAIQGGLGNHLRLVALEILGQLEMLHLVLDTIFLEEQQVTAELVGLEALEVLVAG